MTSVTKTKKTKAAPGKPRKVSAKKSKATSPVGSIESLLPKERQRDYIKHRIDCKCILPQFKSLSPALFHKFIVFSVIDLDGSCVPSYAQCNNCGVIHKVTEIGRSEIIKKETSPAIKSIEDIKLGLPIRLVGLLEQGEVDLPTWQEAEFIISNKLWGRPVLLGVDKDGGSAVGKYVIILGDNLFKVETFEKEIETDQLISG